MKGITLHQPFASAIFTPIKQNPVLMMKRDETRSFAYPAKMKGERIFIHAGVKRLSDRQLSDALSSEAFLQFGGDWRDVLDFGVILGTVVLGECRPADAANPQYITRMFGDYSMGRFAWELLEPRALEKPIPAKGLQGWWNYDLEAQT